jgi:putative inorganic carbon (HCO3(-)) transporter
MSKFTRKHSQSFGENLRDFPGRALTITLCIFIAFVPLAYSPEGAEFEGLFDDFYYQPKLCTGLFLLAVAAAFYIILLLQKRAALVLRPVFLYVGAFLIALAVATILSPYPKLAFWGRKWRSEGLLAFLMYGAAFFLFALSADSARKVKTYLYAFLVGAGIASVYGLLQFFGLEFLPRNELRSGWWRAFATSGNPAFLSAYLLLALPFPILFFLFPRKETHHGDTEDTEKKRRERVIMGKTKAEFCLILTKTNISVLVLRALRASVVRIKTAQSWLWLGLAALIFSCILATYHRGAWVGLVAGAIFALVLLKRNARLGLKIPLRRIAILVVVFLTCVVIIDRSAIAVGNPSLIVRVSEGTKPGSVGSSTIRVRTYIWRATLPLIARRPAFGWGPDTMHEVWDYAPKPHELGYTGKVGGTPDKPENLTLQIAYEGGLVALTAFVIAVGLFLIIMWRAASRLEGFEKTAALAILVGCVSHLAQQQFSFSSVSSSPVFWSLLGLGLAISHRRWRSHS